MNTKTDSGQLLIVEGILLDQEGRVLLLKRHDGLERAAGQWELPGGQVAFGKQPLEELERLVQEQTGFSVISGKLLASDSFVSEISQRHVIIFYNIVSMKEIETSMNPALTDMHSEYAWVKYTDLQHFTLENGLGLANRKIQLQLAEMFDEIQDGDRKTTFEKLIIFCDGGSRGNPGPSASGFVILNNEQEVIEEGGEYIGITTNNQAEYFAVKLALLAARSYHPELIVFKLDSLLVVNQLKGDYKVRNKDLWPIHDAIKQLLTEFKLVTFEHVPREQNTLADGKVNEILDSRTNIADRS